MLSKDKSTYRLDEVGKVILRGLQESGRTKTFSQILDEANYDYDNARQVEIAISLEALELIKNVTYQLPLKITAELTMLGNDVANALNDIQKGKLRTLIANAKRHLGNNYQLSFGI